MFLTPLGLSINADKTLSDLPLRGQWRDFLRRRSRFNPFSLRSLSLFWSILLMLRHGLSVRQFFFHAIGQSSFLCRDRSSFEELCFRLFIFHPIIPPRNFQMSSGISSNYISRKVSCNIWPWDELQITCATLQWFDHCKIPSTIDVSDVLFVFVGIAMRYVATWTRRFDFSRYRPCKSCTHNIKVRKRPPVFQSIVRVAVLENKGPRDWRQVKQTIEDGHVVRRMDVLRHVITLHSPRGNETLFGSLSISSSSDSSANSSRIVRADDAATESVKLATIIPPRVSLFSTI